VTMATRPSNLIVMITVPRLYSFVMPGLVPGIHVFLLLHSKTWMVGTSCAKTRFALLPGHDALR
jgi:hypothetical protein